MKIVLFLFLLAGGMLFGAEPVTLTIPTGKLFGTLEVPNGKGPFPVALIHAGSGLTDRDGNSQPIPGKNNSLKMLAEALAEKGIASLRYDKRGIAASREAGPKEMDLRFETYIDDAVAWGKYLRSGQRFTKLVIIGHSEGALIGSVAAQLLPADGFVSMAGSGKPAGQSILDQLQRNAPPELLQQAEEIIKGLSEGRPTENTPPSLFALFRPSVQPYLISWFKYDPAKEIAKGTYRC